MPSLKPLPQSSFLLMHRWPAWRRGDGHGDAPVPAKILQSKTSPLLFRPNQSHIQPLLLASSCLAPRPGAVGVGDAPSLDPLSVPQEKRAESGRRWPQVAGKSGGSLPSSWSTATGGGFEQKRAALEVKSMRGLQRSSILAPPTGILDGSLPLQSFAEVVKSSLFLSPAASPPSTAVEHR
jgi:hypothetical protein